MEKLINFKPNGILDITVKTSKKGNPYLILVLTEATINKEYDSDNLKLLVKISEFLNRYTIDFQTKELDKKNFDDLIKF